MRNIILTILWFLIITWLTIYLQAKVTVNSMVKAVDTEWNVFKECVTKLTKWENIKNIKFLKKNIRFHKCLDILIFLIFLALITIIEILLKNYTTNWLKLYNILSSIYYIYNILALFSNKYKKIITSEYELIFDSILKLKWEYDNNIHKIPFTDKIEIYNYADNNIKLKNKLAFNPWEDNDYTYLGEHLKQYYKEKSNINKDSSQEDEDFPQKQLMWQKQLSFKKSIDKNYTKRDAEIEDNWPKITILKNGYHPFYSVYAKNYPKEVDWQAKWYIEISSSRGLDLEQAKTIAGKLYDIVIWYKTPEPNNEWKKVDINKKISLFNKRIDKWYIIREMDIEDEWTIRILKNENHPFYSVYIKKYTFRFWMRTWYIDISSSKALDLAQAEIIVNKLYNIAAWYNAPSSWVE